jgi:site-specific DNA-adenine methylase
MMGGVFSKDTKWDVNITQELQESKKKLDNVTIENFDFRDLIPRYAPREGDMFYLDPPYVVAKKGYYRNVFDEQCHVDLKESVDLIDEGGGYFMISYDDKYEIRELYKNYNIKTIDTKYVGAAPEKRGEIRTELVILNYKPKEQFQLF